MPDHTYNYTFHHLLGADSYNMHQKFDSSHWV